MSGSSAFSKRFPAEINILQGSKCSGIHEIHNEHDTQTHLHLWRTATRWMEYRKEKFLRENLNTSSKQLSRILLFDIFDFAPQGESEKLPTTCTNLDTKKESHYCASFLFIKLGRSSAIEFEETILEVLHRPLRAKEGQGCGLFLLLNLVCSNHSREKS